MSSPSRSPSEHYQEAERLIAATAETPQSAPLLALAHALLAAAPRRALRGHTPPDHGGLPPALSWGDER